MLKFVRKYQLFILAIGGTLLMLVFLLEPVITSFQGLANDRTVASYTDGTKIKASELGRAEFELELAEQILPMVFGQPGQGGGLGLIMATGEDDTPAYHWMMMRRMVEEAGLNGGAADGQAMIDQAVEFELAVVHVPDLQQQVRIGAIKAEDYGTELANRRTILRSRKQSAVSNASNYIRGATEQEILSILGGFRGAYRLQSAYVSAPSFSPDGARVEAAELMNSVAVDAAVLDGNLLAGSIDDPGEEALQEFFDARADVAPADDEFGIGYAQPARIQLGWIELRVGDLAAGVETDLVELRKIWQLDSEKPEGARTYPGDFALERSRIEAQFRRDRAQQLLIEADRAVKAAIAQATRELPNEDGRLILPDDWAQVRPSLEEIAARVVETVRTQTGATIPTPTVVRRDDTWLTANSMIVLPGIGQSGFRLGSRVLPMYAIPEAINELGEVTDINLRVGVLQTDPAAQDQGGNRFYPLITGVRAAGSAYDMAEIGRDRVLTDYRAVEGFRRLEAMSAGLSDSAGSESGVVSAVDMAVNAAGAEIVRPGVYRNLLVSQGIVRPGALSRAVDPRINNEAFRDAVLEAAGDVDPLASPDEVLESGRAIAIAIPESRIVAVARLVAPRPLTAEDYAQQSGAMLRSLQQVALVEALGEEENGFPFSFAALSEHFGFELPAEESEAEEESAATNPEA